MLRGQEKGDQEQDEAQEGLPAAPSHFPAWMIFGYHNNLYYFFV